MSHPPQEQEPRSREVFSWSQPGVVPPLGRNPTTSATEEQLKDSRAAKYNQVLLSAPGDPTAPHGQTHSTPMPTVVAGVEH